MATLITRSPVTSPSASGLTGTDPSVERELDKRLAEYRCKIFRRMDELNMSSLKSKIIVEIDPDDCGFNAGVTALDGGNIHIGLTLPFLARQEDLNPSTPMGSHLQLFYHSFGKTGDVQLKVFEKLCQNPALFEKAKEFLVSHELAHAYHGDIYSTSSSDDESRGCELRADLTACTGKPDLVDGGIYWFDILEPFYFPGGETHPHNRERAQYLRAHKAAQYAESVRKPADAPSSKTSRSISGHVQRMRTGIPHTQLIPSPATERSRYCPEPDSDPVDPLVTVRGRLHKSTSSSSSAHAEIPPKVLSHLQTSLWKARNLLRQDSLADAYTMLLDCDGGLRDIQSDFRIGKISTRCILEKIGMLNSAYDRLCNAIIDTLCNETIHSELLIALHVKVIEQQAICDHLLNKAKASIGAETPSSSLSSSSSSSSPPPASTPVHPLAPERRHLRTSFPIDPLATVRGPLRKSAPQEAFAEA